MMLLFFISASVVLYAFIFYPVVLYIFSFCKQPLEKPAQKKTWPFVSILIPVYNGEQFIREKIEWIQALSYPPDRLEIVIASDGSNDQTVSIAGAIRDTRIRVLDFSSRRGKNRTINEAIPYCKGSLLFFSDVDALPEKESVTQMVSWFNLPEIGGVCGKKVVKKSCAAFDNSQKRYVSYQEWIKSRESRLYSTATNEGKVHMMRRSLFMPYRNEGCDDLNNLLHVVRQGHRFVFDASAHAIIPVPSRDATQEIRRRRRIVHRSFCALWYHRAIFNPFKYGVFSIMVFSQKIVRRLAPLFMGLFVLSCFFLIQRHIFFGVVAGINAVLLLCTLVVHVWSARIGRMVPRVYNTLYLLYYFVLGNTGTLLGLVSFILNRGRIGIWDSARSSSGGIHSARQNRSA